MAAVDVGVRPARRRLRDSLSGGAAPGRVPPAAAPRRPAACRHCVARAARGPRRLAHRRRIVCDSVGERDSRDGQRPPGGIGAGAACRLLRSDHTRPIDDGVGGAVRAVGLPGD